MNILSFALILASIVIFAGAARGQKWGSLGFGLAIAHLGWLLHILWVADHVEKLG